MRKTHLSVLVAVLAALSVLQPVMAAAAEKECPKEKMAMHPGGEGHGAMNKPGRLLRDPEVQKALELSQDTVKKIDAKLTEQEKYMVKTKADLKLLKIDLETEFKKDKISLPAVKDLAGKIDL